MMCACGRMAAAGGSKNIICCKADIIAQHIIFHLSPICTNCLFSPWERCEKSPPIKNTEK